MLTPFRLLLLTAAGPPLAWTAIEIGTLVLAMTGDHPRWRTQTVNVSEAAAIRDFAEVARLVEGGESPSERRVVRAGIINRQAHLLTPLEAAAIAGRDEIVTYLLDQGAQPSPDEWLRLRCHAEASDAEELGAILSDRLGGDVGEACDGVPPLLPE
jgi:hypothetical protein